MRVFLVISLLITFLGSEAQSDEIGVQGGMSVYFGDVNPEMRIGDFGYSGTLIYKHNFDKRFSLRGGLSYGKIFGQDASSHNEYYKKRNHSFETDIFEIEAGAEFNFLPFIPGSQEHFYSPFVFMSLTGMYFAPMAELDGERFNLRDVNTEDASYSQVSPGISYGLGFKYNLTDKWNFNMELSTRYLFTDYIDDVSEAYVSKEQFSNSQHRILSDRSGEVDGEYIGERDRQRGDGMKADSYVYLQIGLTYNISDIKCPKF